MALRGRSSSASRSAPRELTGAALALAGVLGVDLARLTASARRRARGRRVTLAQSAAVDLAEVGAGERLDQVDLRAAPCTAGARARRGPDSSRASLARRDCVARDHPGVRLGEAVASATPTTAHSATAGWRSEAALDLGRGEPLARDLEHVVAAALVDEAAVGVAARRGRRSPPIRRGRSPRSCRARASSPRRALRRAPRASRTRRRGGRGPRRRARARRSRRPAGRACRAAPRPGGWRGRRATARRCRGRRGARRRTSPRQRSSSGAGSASPAEVASRSEERSLLRSPPDGSTIWLTIVGTLTSSGRPVARDRGEDRVGRGALGEEAGAGADREREEQVRAHRVAEEELGHREGDVASVSPSMPLAVGDGGVGVGAVALHDRLRPAGGAAGEEPDRRVVAVGRDGGEAWRDGARELFERRAARSAARRR